jgi:hypothetical protein
MPHVLHLLQYSIADILKTLADCKIVCTVGRIFVILRFEHKN